MALEFEQYFEPLTIKRMWNGFGKYVVAGVVLLIIVGALAGFFVVPMNAMLQHRGCTLLTAGRSIAVQGFNENAGMLLMLCIYAATIALDIPLYPLIIGFGILVACPMAILYAVSKSTLPIAEPAM